MLVPPAISRVAPTIARVPHRAVLSIAGSQVPEFLHGILSASVHTPPRPFYSAFLHAQGRVLYDAFFYTRTGPDGQKSYLIDYDDTPSDAALPLLQLIKRYVLRARVKVRDASDEYDVWAAWGSEEETSPRKWRWAEHSGVAEPVWDEADGWAWGSADCELRDRRAPGMGRRLLVRKGDTPAACSSSELADSEAYTLHRILHGVPEGSADFVRSHALPMESNLDFMGAVDFRKGCWVGQELTVRTYHTGMIRKRILPVVLHPPGSLPTGPVTPNPNLASFPAHLEIKPVLSDPQTTRTRGSGKLLSSVNGVGLALMRLEQVEAAEQGKLGFALDVKVEGATKRWQVSHWRPEWWPQPDGAL
ncbi:Aminomethyltransferase folate-binding domain-containing protein [Mycena kentingensis (nom. inval.)]|nr:Aminomethyltransferase folate-binding domain-containing protein [Mycena kentingensis (nom. inval.)]